MDLSALATLAVACVAVVIVIRVFATTLGQRAARDIRFADDPWEESWLTVEEVAERLNASVPDVLRLVTFDAIPFFVVRGVDRRDPAAYRFRPEEIEEWVIE